MNINCFLCKNNHSCTKNRQYIHYLCTDQKQYVINCTVCNNVDIKHAKTKDYNRYHQKHIKSCTEIGDTDYEIISKAFKCNEQDAKTKSLMELNNNLNEPSAKFVLSLDKLQVMHKLSNSCIIDITKLINTFALSKNNNTEANNISNNNNSTIQQQLLQNRDKQIRRQESQFTRKSSFATVAVKGNSKDDAIELD